MLFVPFFSEFLFLLELPLQIFEIHFGTGFYFLNFFYEQRGEIFLGLAEDFGNLLKAIRSNVFQTDFLNKFLVECTGVSDIIF